MSKLSYASPNSRVALLQDTRTSTNVMLISLERTLEGLLRQIASQLP